MAVAPVAAAQTGVRSDSIRVSQPDAYVMSLERSFDDAAGEVDVPVEYRDVTVEGVVVSVRTRRTGDELDALLIDAEPIADALQGRFEMNESTLTYHRHQDGAVITMDFADGDVRSNGVLVGKLPSFEPIEKAGVWLGPNAIAVLTGTVVNQGLDGELIYALDKRLRPEFDLDVWVNGRPVDTFGNEARTVGPVLLVPLGPVAEALGHELRVEPGFVTVVRSQDSAVIKLDLASGLVSVNNTPRLVTPNMSFSDRNQLLLPFSAVETLTGTHITVTPGSNRIDISLDDRLGDAGLPGDAVSSGIGNTPLTPEALSYQLSDRGPVMAQFSSRVDRVNSRLTYESAGGMESRRELEPSWLSLDVQSLDGWVGSAGDYSERHRELSGVDVSRIRGLSYREQLDDGTLVAVAGGSTLTGTERLSDTASKPEFGGFAAGVRVLGADGSQELGASMKSLDGGETSAFVLSGQKVLDQNGKEGVLQSAYVSADVGHFDTKIGSGLDIRGRGQARYRITDQINAAITAYHVGEKFTASATDSAFQGVFDNRVGARTGGSVSTDWRSAKSWGLLQYVAVGARASVTHIGGSNDITAQSLVMSVSTRIGRDGPGVSIDIDQTRKEETDGVTDTTSVRARVFQRFDWGIVQASYDSQPAANTAEQAVVAVQGNPFRKSLGEGAYVSLAPSATLARTDGYTSLRVGASAAFSSGSRLGDKLTVDGQMSALPSVNPDDNDTRYFANLRARYLINKNTELTASYFDDLQGRNDLSVALRGTIAFNEPRQHALPLEDRGALTGTVFVDLNRDGIRQEIEPGVPGARLSVRGTRLSLATDRDGNFMIQNIKEGVSVISVSRQSLPLGYMVSDGQLSTATITSGRRTNVEIPIVMSGQVRGAVFVDMDGDGKAGPEDQRLEGQAIQLIDASTSKVSEAASASFGQYGFENLSAGKYRLRVMIGWQEFNVDVELADDDLLKVVPIAVPPALMGMEPPVDAALPDEIAAAA
ncbi:SdrD B-like domain-containing protein [Henriciella sp. AS95]|uniref:MSCRAMM family protein n=1 Tax=Henriciella sp. AS95 TaxID=3135782 RepID=UPI00316F48F3